MATEDPFPATRWSLVFAARDRGSPEARAALDDLCRSYWYPIYAFIRRRGHNAEDAADLTQGFFAAFLESDALAGLIPAKGRFRAFLLASCKNFLGKEREHERAAKRGDRAAIASINADEAEAKYLREPAHDLTPERLFDRRWALTLLEAALDDLRLDHDRRGKLNQFEALKATLPGDGRSTPLAEVARVLGMTEGAAQVAAHRFRTHYREALRARIAPTVNGPDAIDDEIRDLFAALSREKLL